MSVFESAADETWSGVDTSVEVSPRDRAALNSARLLGKELRGKCFQEQIVPWMEFLDVEVERRLQLDDRDENGLLDGDTLVNARATVFGIVESCMSSRARSLLAGCYAAQTLAEVDV